ncbi:cohesin domain-containing protein [Vescimonas sp.]|uniref:cohesin domain-containing protein n=1 Tax=Vescimonas sp. TaxID=2892404 RepID=UPI00307B6150
MKNRKRMLSVLLALAVVFTMCITAAVAADTGSGSAATITVETVKNAVQVGDTVTLNVSIAGNPGFAAFDFTVKYDAGKLELTKAEQGNIEGSFIGNKDTGNVNLFVAADKKEYTEDGVLFSLMFNVKADCADGAQVTLNTTTFKNAQGVELSTTIVAGGINVTTGSTTGGTGSTTGGTGSTTGGTGSTTGGTGSTTGGTGSTTGGTGSTTGGTGSTTGGTGSTTGGTGSTTGGTGSTTGGTGSTTGGTGSTTGGTGSTTGGTGSTTGGTGSTTGGTGSTTGGTGSTTGGTGSTAKYEIIEGANGTWTQNSDGTLTVRANGEFSKFVGVKVDGEFINSKNYTAKAGSTIVTLSKDYLATLSVGDHALSVVFNDGEARTNFTVNAVTPDNPQTGDHSGIVLAVAVLLVSGGALTVLGIAKKKAGKC